MGIGDRGVKGKYKYRKKTEKIKKKRKKNANDQLLIRNVFTPRDVITRHRTERSHGGRVAIAENFYFHC